MRSSGARALTSASAATPSDTSCTSWPAASRKARSSPRVRGGPGSVASSSFAMHPAPPARIRAPATGKSTVRSPRCQTPWLGPRLSGCRRGRPDVREQDPARSAPSRPRCTASDSKSRGLLADGRHAVAAGALRVLELDIDVLHLGVLPEPLEAILPAEAALLEATHLGVRIKLAERVDPHHAR